MKPVKEITMTEEEKDVFLNQDSTAYYQYIKQDLTFSSLVEKNINREKLTDSEWEYILFRLYLVLSKAISEEDRATFVNAIMGFLSKIGMKITLKERPLYNECLKMAEMVGSIKKEKEINNDILDFYYEALERKGPTDLDILLAQYEEADIFRKNRKAYLDAYTDSTYGVITPSERMYMNAFRLAYQREKELVKRRKSCTKTGSL